MTSQDEVEINEPKLPKAQIDLVDNHISGAIPNLPTATSLAKWKDAIGILQNVFAIAAIIAGGVWFYAQHLLRPVIKTTITPKLYTLDNVYHVDVSASFENVGHVPYKFSCYGIIVQQLSEHGSPQPECPHGVIEPGARLSIPYSWVIGVHEAQDTNYVLVRIGEINSSQNSWRDGTFDATEPLFLPPQGAQPVK